MYLIVNQMPHITPAYIEDALTKAVTSLQSYGLVGGHSEDLSYYGPPSQPIQAYRKIVEAQQSFKVHVLQHHTVFEEVAKMDLASSPFLEFGAMKIFIDGAFEVVRLHYVSLTAMIRTMQGCLFIQLSN